MQLKKSCAKDGCTRKHNKSFRWVGNDRSDSHLTNCETNPVLTANACGGFLQMVSVKLSNGANWLETLAVCDTEETLSFLDSEIKFLLGIDGTNWTDTECGRQERHARHDNWKSFGKMICEQLWWNCDDSRTTMNLIFSSGIPGVIMHKSIKVTSILRFSRMKMLIYRMWKLSSDKIIFICFS